MPQFGLVSDLFPSSTKDVLKAVVGYLSSPDLPLPDHLFEVIEAYLDKNHADLPSERLHEELLAIWERSVKETPAAHAGWLAVLRKLLPALSSAAYLEEWWDLVHEPILDHLANDKVLASEAWSNTLAVLTCDNIVQDGLNQLAPRLLDTWMQNVEHASREDNSSTLLKIKLIRGALLNYGKKRPKVSTASRQPRGSETKRNRPSLTSQQGLLVALDSYFVKKDYRAHALTLLCEFIQSQPPHLHVVLETNLFENILRCLQLDTSATVVTLAVTALTMLLPNVPSSLVPHLPVLFNIYARLLFWDRDRSLAADNPTLDPSGAPSKLAADWELCIFSPNTDSHSIHNLMSYFTILYGLYPLNFVDYIRKPRRYLRHAEYPLADTIEIQPSEIRQKSERFRQYHVLHPNFYSLTVESEKTELGRWIKSEAAEVVAECTALCMATHFNAGPEHGVHQDLGIFEMEERGRLALDQPFLTEQAIQDRSSVRDQSWRSAMAAGSSDGHRLVGAVLRRHSLSSHAPSMREALQSRTREPGPGDSPTLPPSLASSASHTNLQDMIHSNKAIKIGFHPTLANDNIHSLALSQQDSPPEKTCRKLSAASALRPVNCRTSSPEIGNEQVSQLNKKILVLSNDLTFERYMKQQHMACIGELKRRQLKEAATEAETQNLILINRNLRNRLEEAKRSELRAKKESENRRTLSKKWETDLSAKVKTLREEQKKWNSESAALKRELDTKTQECEKLGKMLCAYETTDLNSQQNLQAVKDHVEEITRLKKEVDRFDELEESYKAKEKIAEERFAEAAECISRTEMLSMKLTARDNEVAEARTYYESQIAILKAKLQDALQHGGGARGGEDADRNPSAAVKGALAASRAKMAELQRQHNMLLRKYTTLQTTLQSPLLGMATQTSIVQSSSANELGLASTVKGISRSQQIMPAASDSSDAEVSAIFQGGDLPSPTRRRSTRGRGFSDPELFSEGVEFNVTQPLEALASASSSFGTVVRRPSTPGWGIAESAGGGMEKCTSERSSGRVGVAQNSGRKVKKDKKLMGIRMRNFV